MTENGFTDVAANPVSITWWVQWLLSGRHFDIPKVGYGHVDIANSKKTTQVYGIDLHK